MTLLISHFYEYMNIDKYRNGLYYYDKNNYDIKIIEKKKLSNDSLTRKEKIVLNYDTFLKTWCINNTNDKNQLRDFFEKHYNKDKLLDYARNFNKIGLNVINKHKKVLMVEKILEHILDVNKDDLKYHVIKHTNIDDIISKIRKHHQYFNGKDKGYNIDYNLGKRRNNYINKDPRLFWKKVNVILKECNLKIKRDRKSEKIFKGQKLFDYILLNNGLLYQDIIDLKENFADIEDLDLRKGDISYKSLFENRISNLEKICNLIYKYNGCNSLHKIRKAFYNKF